MIFGLEVEDDSLINPMALSRHLHPIRSMLRNKRQNLSTLVLVRILNSLSYTYYVL